MRLIDADELKNRLEDCLTTGYGEIAGCIRHIFCMIDDTPTIEAEPVRHGQWIALEGWFNKGNVKCSVCGNTLNMNGVNAGRGDANFCPNCGADMREVSEDAEKD